MSSAITCADILYSFILMLVFLCQQTRLVDRVLTCACFLSKVEAPPKWPSEFSLSESQPFEGYFFIVTGSGVELLKPLSKMSQHVKKNSN